MLNDFVLRMSLVYDLWCEFAVPLHNKADSCHSNDRWILTKLVPDQSRANETLHFLLDHPRRCFIYLFPSHQTWFLVTVLIILKYVCLCYSSLADIHIFYLCSFIDWFFFLVLDIGNPAIDYIPIGVRFIAGLLQATAVRAAGFGLVPLAVLAPAVKCGVIH